MSTLRYIKLNYSLYLMIIPAIIIIFLFCYLPIFGIIMAFEDFTPVRGFFGSPFVGLKYFKQFFTDPYILRILKNTVMFGVWGIALFPCNIIFALLLNEIRGPASKKVFQTVSIFPFFISVVIVVGLIKNLLNPTTGVISLLSSLGVKNIPDLMSDPSAFRPIYFISGVWSSIGYGSIIYLAGIAGVNPELYESSVIDGAGRFKQMWYITIPSIWPTIVFLFIMSLGGFFANYDTSKLIIMYNPLTYETADTVGTYTYRAGILGANASYATAVQLLFSILAMGLVFLSNHFSRKYAKLSIF